MFGNEAPVQHSTNTLSGVRPCTDQVHRHIRFVADDPAVVPWGHMENVASTQLDNPSVVHGRRRAPLNHEPDVFDIAPRLTERVADVLGPFPSRLIYRAAECRSADMDDLEPPFGETANFIRIVEALHDHIHGAPPFVRHDQGATPPFAKSCTILPVLDWSSIALVTGRKPCLGSRARLNKTASCRQR